MRTIMDMALEAGFTERELIRAVDSITRFAALVRADELKRFRIHDLEMLLKVRAEQIVSIQDEIRNLMGEE